MLLFPTRVSCLSLSSVWYIRDGDFKKSGFPFRGRHSGKGPASVSNWFIFNFWLTCTTFIRRRRVFLAMVTLDYLFCIVNFLQLLECDIMFSCPTCTLNKIALDVFQMKYKSNDPILFLWEWLSVPSVMQYSATFYHHFPLQTRKIRISLCFSFRSFSMVFMQI